MLTRQLTYRHASHFSRNRLDGAEQTHGDEAATAQVLAAALPKCEELFLSDTRLTWAQAWRAAGHLPRLHKLALAENHLRELTAVDAHPAAQTLCELVLVENELTWDALVVLGRLPKYVIVLHWGTG